MKEPMNKIHEGEIFKVYSLDGHGGINTNPSEEKSIEGCREAIDRRNEWTKTEQGKFWKAKPEAFLIVRKVWNRIYTPDDRIFLESHETERVVEIYPRELLDEKEGVKSE